MHLALDHLIQNVTPTVQHMLTTGSLFPHMAYITLEGELSGKIYQLSDDESVSVQQAIQELKCRLQEMSDKKEIQAGAIFYHSPGVDANAEAFSLPATSSLFEARCLVASLDHISGESLYLMIPYALTAGGVEYDQGTLVKKDSSVVWNVEA